MIFEKAIYETMVSGFNKIKKSMDGKKRLSSCELAVGSGCVCVIALMFYRCFFGTALVDEAYYVSDALAMMHGNLPYAYNWFSGCGMDFLLIPVLFVYECLVPDLEGVFLFSRICFVLFRMGILLYLFITIKKYLPRVQALLLVGVILPFYGAVIQNFSYNTIPIWMGFLAGILLWNAYDGRQYKRINYFAAGFCSAIAVFAHPIYAVVVLLFMCLILIYDKKIFPLLWYIVGGCAEILIVLIPVAVQSGFHRLVSGLAYILNSHVDKGSSLVRSTPASRLMDAFQAFWLFWLVELLVFVVIWFLSNRLHTRVEKSLNKESRYILAVVCAAGAGTAEVMVLNNFDLNAYCSLGSVGALAFLLLFWVVRKRKGIVYVGLPPVLFACMEVILTGSNSAQIRFYSCVLCFFAVLWTCFLDGSRIVHLAAAILSLVMTILQCYIDFNYIYKDDSFRNLDYIVETGVYKGIYTSADRAHDLPELEQYLDDMVEDQEMVAFRDNAPCAYLMKNQNICDVWTWDTLQYERGNKNPYKMYSYYKMRNAIPDKIIYVDFDRTEILSIEDPDFPYNEFIERFYTLEDDRQINTTFRIKLYVNNETFNGDYDYWINQFK